MDKNEFKENIKVLAATIFAFAAFFLLVKYTRPFGIGGEDVRLWASQWLIEPVRGLFQKTTRSPVLIVILVLTLALERFIPANNKQKMFSVSFFQDMVWFVYETCLQAILLTTYIYALRQLYNTYFSEFTIYAVEQWPYWGRFGFGILFTDFLYWLQHYINHKVPWFWQMHAVHHSQKEINFFTDFRYHIVEYVVRHTVLVIPFLFLKVSIPTIVWFAIFKNQYTHFYHGNIKTNLGPLKYILVTPQSHRVHHSILHEHQDKNFGAIFSVWDFLFRTQVLEFDAYPKTGIKDEGFPHEKTKNPITLAIMPLIQMFYPFRSIGRSLMQKIKSNQP